MIYRPEKAKRRWVAQKVPEAEPTVAAPARRVRQRPTADEEQAEDYTDESYTWEEDSEEEAEEADED